MGVLTDNIDIANAIGRANLLAKGVEVSENATTYEIMQKTADVSGGAKSYVDAICEYYSIDKATYPYIAVAVQDDKKTRLIYSAEPLNNTETKTFYHRTASKTTGLVGETDNGVVFGWLKGYMSPSGSFTQATFTTVAGTWFANYPIEETDTVKYYPL